MRIIKLIIVSVFFLFLVITIISLFIPSHILISRNVQIDNNKEAVIKELSDPVKWKEWYPGADSARLFYDSGVVKGIILSEKPERLLLLDAIKDDEIATVYKESSLGKEINSVWKIYPDTVSDHVVLQWYMDFHLGWYPWKKFASLLYDKSYGAQMGQGLIRLKKRLEAE